MNSVELGPITKQLDLAVTPAVAFRAFSEEIGAWWPLASHSRGAAMDGVAAVDVRMDPCVGGRLREVLDDGRELAWGEVLVWEPAARLAFSWQLGMPPAETTRVDLTFEAHGSGCRVTLVHSGWDRIGPSCAERRAGYDSGWEGVFGAAYAGHAGD